MPTQVRRTLITMLETYRATGVTRAANVPVQVMRKPRGKTIIHIGEGDVVLTLTDAERIALHEALAGDPVQRGDTGCSPNEGTV